VHVVLHEDDLVAHRHDIEHRHHVAVVDLGGNARLVEKHRDKLAVLRELGMHALRSDDARESNIADEVRDVDRRHAAPRDLAVQLVSADGDGLLAVDHSTHRRMLVRVGRKGQQGPHARVMKRRLRESRATQ
jgi:hypothetical protein